MKSCANESRAMLAWALPSAAKIGRRQICFISSISGRYKTSRTLIVAHIEMRSVGIALCYDMGVRSPPSAFEGILARMGA